MAEKRIVLVRHGKQEKLGTGFVDADAPLACEGRSQLERLSDTHGFVPEQFKILEHSPLRRAVESAQTLFPDAVWRVNHALGIRCAHSVAEVTLQRLAKEVSFGKNEAENFHLILHHQISRNWAKAVEDDVLGSILGIALRMEPGQAALLISHQPGIHWARKMLHTDLRQPEIPVLQPGEAYDMQFNEHGMVSCTTLTAD